MVGVLIDIRKSSRSDDVSWIEHRIFEVLEVLILTALDLAWLIF